MEALGLAAAEDVVAPIDLPSFDNSAMDGYAVTYADVVAATADNPVHLPVVGEIGAGQAQLLAVSPGTSAKIMTGAPLPAGADTVVPYEWTDRGVAQVRIDRAPSLGQHVRPAGEDVQVGDVLLSLRHRPRAAPPRPARLGRPRDRAHPPAPAGGRPLHRLRAPRARHPARPRLDLRRQLLPARGRRPPGRRASPTGSASCPTSRSTFLDALQDQLVRADIVITSGGVSQGDFDVVKEALRPLGTVWFGGVAMQPGKPQGFGQVGEDGTPIFTLPGNPVSSYVSFEQFVLPAHPQADGQDALLPARPCRARLTHAITSPAGRRQLVRGGVRRRRRRPRRHAGRWTRFPPDR